jgi:protocatechuate 3,4-dioxygenase beta subunit
MKTTSICALIVSYLALIAQAQTSASLRGTVTDPSSALVPGALVQLRGPGPEQRATSDDKGQYSFAALQPGKYTVRVIAKGFTVGQ